MKNIFLLLLIAVSFTGFAQKNDTDLKSQVNTEIKLKPPSASRSGAMYDTLIDGKQSLYADKKIISGTTYTVQNWDVGKTLHATHASGTTITITNTLPDDMVFHVARDAGAGTVTFVAGGTASLSTMGGELALESEVLAVTWIKYSATVFQGFGALGPASSGVTDGDKGDITVTASGATWTIDNLVVTPAKMSTFSSADMRGKYSDELGTGAALFDGATPTSFVGTNITGTASGLTAGTVTTNANLTGHVTSTGNAAVLGSFSSANLSGALSDESGSGLSVFSESTTNTQTASYVLVAGDRGKEVEMNVASANTVTVPPNSSVAFPVGTKVFIFQYGAGLTSIVEGSGVTVNASANTLAGPGQFNLMMLEKRGTDEWYLANGAPPFTGAALTATDGLFDFTVNNGANALVNAANFTATLNGVSALAIGDLVSSNATNQFSVITAVTAGRYLRSAGSLTLPVWSTLVLPNSINANRIVYGSASNTYGESANLTYDGSLFTITGGTAFGYAAKTTTYTLTTADRFIECTSGTFTVTLPTAVGKSGIVYTIDNSGAGVITLATTSSQTIDGAVPGTLIAGNKITLYSNGANWRTY